MCCVKLNKLGNLAFRTAHEIAITAKRIRLKVMLGMPLYFWEFQMAWPPHSKHAYTRE